MAGEVCRSKISRGDALKEVLLSPEYASGSSLGGDAITGCLTGVKCC
jgi:hypothetical protein